MAGHRRRVRTISSKTSLAAKASPSFFFHDAIPPSVIVGDMAGMANLETALRAAVMCIPARTFQQTGCVLALESLHRRLDEARRAALETWWRGCMASGMKEVKSYVRRVRGGPPPLPDATDATPSNRATLRK